MNSRAQTDDPSTGTANGDALVELKEFASFLQNLWGLLVSATMLFPLANTFYRVIPIGFWDQYTPKGGLAYASPDIVTATATLGASFTALWLFNHRYEFLGGVDRNVIRQRARRSFIVGVLALLIYLVVNFAIFEGFYWTVFRWTMDNPLRLLGDIILLVSYSGFFVSMARAFMLLGMLEYYVSD